MLEPFGAGNPAVALLVPAATVENPRPLGDEERHVAFSLVAGGARCARRALRRRHQPARGPRGAGGRRRAAGGERLQRDRRAARDRPPRAALRGRAGRARGGARDVRGRCPGGGRGAARVVGRSRATAAGGSCATCATAGWPARSPTSSRRVEPVLVVAAHAHRARTLGARMGGFAVCSYAALADAPELAAAYPHVVALDPPVLPELRAVLDHAPGAGFTHLAWGAPELRFCTRDTRMGIQPARPVCRRLPSASRRGGGSRGEALESVLRGEGAQPRTPAVAGRIVRILTELGLAVLDRAALGLDLAGSPGRTSLERSAAFMAYRRRLEDGQRYLTTSTQKAAWRPRPSRPSRRRTAHARGSNGDAAVEPTGDVHNGNPSSDGAPEPPPAVPGPESTAPTSSTSSNTARSGALTAKNIRPTARPATSPTT